MDSWQQLHYLVVADVHTLQTSRYHMPHTKMNWATCCFSFYSINHQPPLFPYRTPVPLPSNDCILYTECSTRKGPNFGRVFLRSNYTDITQNTYIQSSMVTEILAREKCGLLWCLCTVLCPWRHTQRIRLTTTGWTPLLQLHSYVIARCS